ncbi:MAG: hypothetical protein HYZ23_02250 [Chloroflexi bacterium]|nr:hypothetical protein [Chloroflexota bacterium]
MTPRRFKHEGWLYALAFLLALGLRFTQLGAMPLTDAEAAPALQSLQIAQGLKPALDPHPLYILSTSILFFIYGGGTNFLARFFPALIGSLLVFAPLLFEERIKPRSGLILAIFIAIDPGLVSLSRQAASPILAIAFLVFAWGFLHSNRLNFAGISTALALLSGPSIWLGILGLAITWAISQAFIPNRASQSSTTEHLSSFRLHLSSFLATFTLAGTLFFIIPNGLSAALASIPAFISRWVTPSFIIPASRLPFSLIIYQPLGVLLGLYAVIRGWIASGKRVMWLSVWFLVALLLAILIPSRQISDLAWALLPLWSLAAIELTRNVDVFREERREVIGVVLLTAFIWAFAWLDFSGMAWLSVTSREFVLRIWLLIGALILILLSLMLVAAGWSIRIARIGGAWGLTLVLGILGLGGAVGAAGLRGLAYPEIWWQDSIPMQADMLEATVSDLSEWGTGNDNAAPVIIVGIDSPALEWALRNHQPRMVESLDVSSAPYFVVTPLQDNPILASAYRGQDFTWRQNPLWSVALLQDWMRWIALRNMPQNGETIILWARDDLFLDSAP